MNGILLVDKPADWTSHDVVAKLRGVLGERRMGHSGTLDPMATGLLVVFAGRATRAVSFSENHSKCYEARLRLGLTTDTQDTTGTVLSRCDRRVTRAELEAALPQFRGDILQTPPMYSALKRDGQKLCDLARQGIDVKVEPRPTQVYAIQVLHENADGSFTLQIRCGRGTYIRTLCHDIGEALGTKAHMGMLLRAQTGMFTLDDAHTIEEIDAADELSPLLTAMDQPLGHLPRLDVQPKAERFVRNGNRLTRRELIGDVQPGQPTRLYLNGQFCGIGRFDGETLKFDAMLLE